MRISREEVRRVAGLARLELDREGEERLRGHLEQILDYVEQLDRLDLDGVPPATGPSSEGAGLRRDRAGASLEAGEALANAPESSQGHFKVPRILPG